MDQWREKYKERKLTVKYEVNNARRMHYYYLVIDGVKDTQNYIEYDEDEMSLTMVNEGSFKV